MAVNKEILENQTEYAKMYIEIIVTYNDNRTKSFTPYEWALFEKGVRKIAKNIQFVKIKELVDGKLD